MKILKRSCENYVKNEIKMVKFFILYEQAAQIQKNLQNNEYWSVPHIF